MLARRELSVPDALRAQERRMAQRAAALHCVVQTLADGAGQARDGLGALAGVGLAHKDIFDLPGRRPGAGHDRGTPTPGLKAAPALSRLARHGAGNLAALAMAEHACGATALNANFPRCVNPLRKRAVVGGSSSGSAVAVAAHLAYGSLGTDTAGSVRIPAATCALLGLKTTHGLVPLGGVQPLAPSLDSVGILARSAADARQLLDVLAPLDKSLSHDQRPPRIRAWIPSHGLNPEVATNLEALLTECDVVQRLDDWPDFQGLSRRADTVLHVEAARIHGASVRDGTACPGVRDVALAGLMLPGQWYADALAERGRLVRDFVQQCLTGSELFLLPALAEPVPDWPAVLPGDIAFDARQVLGLYRFMGFVNYLGLPAIVLPVASDSRGMPISVQLVARPFHERTLLAFAEKVQLRRFDGGAFTRPFYSGD